MQLCCSTVVPLYLQRPVNAPSERHKKEISPLSPDARPNTEHSRVGRKYSLCPSLFHILVILKQKDQREMLQAGSTLDPKNHDDSFFFHPNKIPVFTVNVINRNGILRDLCTSYRLFPPFLSLLPHLLFILQCNKLSQGRVL